MRASNTAIANRLRQRGAGQWPFIITLLLLLVFAYLWWDASDQRDAAKQETKQAKEVEQAVKTALGKMATAYSDLSKSVGWLDKSYDLGGFDPQRRPSVPVTDLAALKAHVQKEGTLVAKEGEDPVKGTLGVLLDEATLQFTREGRLHSEKTGAESTVDVNFLSQEFKDRLEAFRAKWGDNEALSNRPIQPVDSDDDAGMQEYRDKMSEYENTMAEYDRELRELTESQDWQNWQKPIRAPGQWADPTTETIQVTYYSFPEGGEATVQNVFKGIPGAIRGLKSETKALAAAYIDKVQQLTSDNKAKQTSLDQSNETLAREQADFTTQLNNLTQQLAASQAKVTALTDEKNTAQNELQQAKDDHATALRKVSADRDSYREGLANMKERRDHRIRRDLSKGQIVAVSQTLGTGTINIGKADRAYVGQKFVVSAMDRGGNRFNKGEIILTAVDHKHSANFRIVSQAVPVVGGDNIHNPLYNPTDPIHVFIHGKLDKWPSTMVAQRLKPLRVVVQDEINGKTDYIIIPNSMAAPAPAPAEGEEDEEDGNGAAAGSSPLEQLEKRARRFGAVVITERLFDTFLDY